MVVRSLFIFTVCSFTLTNQSSYITSYPWMIVWSNSYNLVRDICLAGFINGLGYEGHITVYICIGF